MNESDPRSDVHYLGSSENKAWKKIQACTGFEPMTSAIYIWTADKDMNESVPHSNVFSLLPK